MTVRPVEFDRKKYKGVENFHKQLVDKIIDEKEVGDKRRKRFTTEQKVQALLILQRNNFKIPETAKQLSILPSLLSLWKNKLGDQVYGDQKERRSAQQQQTIESIVTTAKEKKEELTILKAISEFTANEGQWTNALFYAKFVILNKAVELAEKSKSLRDITGALQIVSDLDKPDSPLESEFQKGKKNFVELVRKQYSFVTGSRLVVTTVNETQDINHEEIPKP